MYFNRFRYCMLCICICDCLSVHLLPSLSPLLPLTGLGFGYGPLRLVFGAQFGAGRGLCVPDSEQGATKWVTFVLDLDLFVVYFTYVLQLNFLLNRDS